MTPDPLHPMPGAPSEGSAVWCGHVRTSWPDMVFVSLEDWDEVWRRNQFIVSRLAKRFPHRRILWVGPPFDVSHALRRGRWSVLRAAIRSGGNLPSPEGFPNVHLLKPVKWLPNASASGRAVNNRSERMAIQRALLRLKMERPLLWINAQHAVHLLGHLEERGVLYDVTDDWTAFPAPARVRARIIADDKRLARAADAVIVCSEHLKRLKEQCSSRVYLIPNGVDVEHYRAAREEIGEIPAFAREWRTPVLGYTGTLHPERLDIDLLCEIARANAPGTVALIGPDHLRAEDRARLRACANVRLVGPVAYADLPRVMRRFDVCIVPHRKTAFTESLDPIKLYDYLATGKPILSTDVAGFRDFAPLVIVCRDMLQFIRLITHGIAEDSGLRTARIDEASRHSWDSRVDAVIRVIQTALGVRG